MELKTPFKITDLPDRGTWSVTWPGYEIVVCENEHKAANLLKILFEEIDVEEAVLSIRKQDNTESYVVRIPWMTYHQNPGAAGRFLASRYAVDGVKFLGLEQAQQFKDIMDRRLAWQRLSGKTWR